MKRVVAALAVAALLLGSVLAVGLVVFRQPGASSGPSRIVRTPTTPPDPSVTAAPRQSLTRFYSQGIDWRACESNDEHDCATIEVPIDYHDPDSQTFELALLRVPAAGQPVGSLVVNPGGPGVPGTSYAELAGMVLGDRLLQNFDIVGFDPRGTGSSSPVDCLSDEELDEYVAIDPTPDSSTEVAAYADVVRDYGRGCEARTGSILGHVTTIETARDMDVLRSALGEANLTYLGASYGTELGATYAELFPDRVGRLVLDGAVDVSADLETKSLEQAAGFETALRAYVQNCLDSTDNCFLGDTVEEGLAKIADFLDDLEGTPLEAGDGRELRAGNAFYGIVAPLYNRDYWFLLSTALTSAFEGRGGALMSLSDSYASRTSQGYVDNSMEAFYAIGCLDSPEAIAVEDIPESFAAFEEVSPTFGRAFAWGMSACDGFGPRSSEKPLDIDGAGAAPIVVIGTTRDPATPMKWAEALSEQLDSAVLVRRDGDGHTGYNMGNECVDSIVEDYLIDGVVPTATDC